MKNLHPSPQFTPSTWFRLGFAIVLALIMSLVLLLLPLASSSSSPQAPVLTSLPLQAELVQAANGLTLTKSANTSAVNQGGLLTYTLTVTNNTGFDITNQEIIVTDTVPANTSCARAASSSNQWVPLQDECTDNGEAFWVKASPFVFTNNTSIRLSYVVTVSQPLPDQSLLTNLASSYVISTPTTRGFGENDVNTLVNAPVWAISKTATPSPEVEAGATLTYTINYSNVGHYTTSGTYTITEQIPPNTTYVANSASPPAIFDGSTLTWALSSTLNISEALAVSFAVTVDEPLTDTLAIVNDNYGISGGNVFAPAFGSPLTVTVDSPVTMTITKFGTPDPVIAGETITYTLTVTNELSSKGPADNVVVTDVLPANTSFVSADFIAPATGQTATVGSSVTWNFDNPNPLQRGESASVLLVVRTNSPLDNNSLITNTTYEAGASNGIVTLLGQPVVTTTISSTPTLEISKSDAPDPVAAGGLITYTIRYSNTGNANATNVLITDTFPASTTFDSETSSPLVTPGSAVPGGRQWSLASLAGEGGTGEITLVLSVDKPQTPGTVITNVVSITSSEVSSLEAATATTTITSTPQFYISKSDDPDPVAIGGFITYTIVYSNGGNADATDVTIADTLPDGVSFNAASNGGTFSNGVVTWSNLTVPANGVTQTLSLSVTVATTLPNNALLTNTVAIFAGDVITTATAATRVRAPALEVSKTISPTGILRAGDNVEYVIVYTNSSTVDIGLPGVDITDTFPISITNVVSSTSSSDGTPAVPQATPFIWHDDELPASGSGTITITGQVITSPWASTGGQIDNSVLVAFSVYSDTDAVNSEGRPGLPFTFTVTALPSTQQVGQNVLAGATASDEYGNPVFDGTPITLTTSLSGSRLNGAASQVLTTSNGEVSTILSSTVAGTTTLAGQITEENTTLTDTQVVTFTPGPAERFIVSATSPQTAGVTFPITITAIDSFGNVVNTFNDSVVISDTTGSIAPTGTTLVNGVRVVSNASITRATIPLSTTITVITGTVSGTVDIQVRPGPPDDVRITVAPNIIPVCGTSNVTATVVDNFLNPLANQPIELSILTGPAPAGNGVLTPTLGTTDSSGVFTSSFQGNDPGNVRLIGESGLVVNSVRPTVTITSPAVPVSLALTVAPNPLASGNNVAVATATVLDCLGPSENQVVNFTVSDPSLVTLGAAADTTNASGVATTTLTSNTNDGTVVVTATVGSLVQTTTLVINSPRLTITKTASPVSGAQVRPNQLLNYTLRVTNSGSAALNNVVITDALPAGVSFSACNTASGASCSGTSVVTVTTPTLAINQVLVTNIQVTVGQVVSGTLLSNQASARSSQTSLITSNLVSHSVTTATVNIFLPLILKDLADFADLTITNFNVTGSDPNRVVTIVIKNEGTASTGDGFWVDFYVNPTTLPNDPSLGGNRRWELTGSSQGIAWPVPALAAGASVTLTSDGSAGIAPAPDPLSKWNGTLPSGTNQLYAFVDSFALENSPFVEIAEPNEDNNMATQTVIATTSAELAPASLPDLSQLPPRWEP